jgi:hypothetical protein
MKLAKTSKFKKWLVFVIFLAVLLFVGFCFLRNNLRQTMFSELAPTTMELQEQLDGGTSPNGALSRIFYHSDEADLSTDLKSVIKSHTSNNPSFGVVIEQTKSYSTSSAKIDGQIPIPPAEFLSNTKSKGNSQLVWHPAKGVWVAIDSLTYHYGDVFGYTLSGQSAKPYIDKLSVYIFIAVIVWLSAAIWLYRFMSKTARKQR